MRRPQRWLLPALGAIISGCFSERSVSEPIHDIACRVPLEAVARGDRIVVIEGQRFLPDTVHVAAGRSVTWVNCERADADPHTTTAQDGSWDSPLLRTGNSYTRQFTATGTYPYTCIPHPHMRAVIIVQ